jgi:hypothetical protein
MVKYRIRLSEEEQEQLVKIISKGSHKSQKVLNALILLNCNEVNETKRTSEQIAAVLQISMRKTDRVQKRFIEEGLEIALAGRLQEREYKGKADGDLEARLIALSCSEAPSGFSRWSLRMLADKAVELQYVESLSYETVRCILKKTNLSPGKRKGG